jgi:hypothetical protein
MATDVWQQARASGVALWLRVHPQQVGTVEADLGGFAWSCPRRPSGRAGTEQALTGVRQKRLQQLLLDEPAVATELRRILDDTLPPMLAPAEQARIGTLIMLGNSHGNSPFNQVARNQINYLPAMIATSPSPPGEDFPGDALVQMSGVSHESSTFN